MSFGLGAFQLERPIAKGGMATVWRGYHRVQKVPVAVKVMTGQIALKPEFATAFRNEVQAVAGMSHPSVVMVFDHGEVTEEVAALSEKRFQAGSPYLVMELASGGTLEDLTMPMPWPAVRNILLVLLDALAHAHARGLVHRDLKPANVLITKEGDIREGLKLTDFGIAHAESIHADRTGSIEVSMGTPYYMAPEQIEGLWRNYGPWTDLYALGCMAYEFVTGEVPFDSEHLVGLAYMHLSDDVPPMHAPLGVPKGFEAWVKRMMAKSPEDRFRRAADAVWSLVQLDDGSMDEEGVLERWDTRAHSGVTNRPAVLLRDTQVVDWGSHAPQSLLEVEETKREVGEVEVGLPPLPMEWRGVETEGPSMKLVGTGLSLYGLRTIPLVGRARERDAIWSALHAVRDHERAHAMVLHGAAGCGKSKLVEWMAQRADEVGSAIVLKGMHNEQPGTNVLSRMMARHFRCMGLEREEVQERLEEVFQALGVEDNYVWEAMTELIHPASGAESGVKFGSSLQRYALLMHYLEFLSQERPIVVWLDDVQWGFDALKFVSFVLDQQEEAPSPVLFLLTARDEALAENMPVAQALAKLTERPDVTRRYIGPLSEEATGELIEELLGLEGELARQLIERTRGNPLFAVQLVGDWVERGILEVGERGFVVRDGEEVRLPDDLYEVWSARIDRLVEGRGQGFEKMLELAAALGQEVDLGELHAACFEYRLKLPHWLMPYLQSQRLMISGDEGAGRLWLFLHGILRESLDRRAREANRRETHHLVCAKMLEKRYPSGKRGVSQRIGHHYIEAGDLEKAILPLLKAAQECRERSDYQQAHDYVRMREEALSAMAFSESDLRWGEGWVLRSWICSNQRDIVSARAWALRAEERARKHGWEKILPQALLGQGVAARDQGHLSASKAFLDEARVLYETQGERLGHAYALQGLGVVARMSGHLQEAETLTQEALIMHWLEENLSGVAECNLRLSEVLLRLGKLEATGEHVEKALELYEQLGDVKGVSSGISMRGDLARLRGSYEQAQSYYSDAIDKTQRLGKSMGTVARQGQGMLYLTLQRWEDAERCFLLNLKVCQKASMRDGEWFSAAALLPCAAFRQDWEVWSTRLQLVKQLSETIKMVDYQVAQCLEMASIQAQAHHAMERASEALELCAEQWHLLGHKERAQKVRAKQKALETGQASA